MDLNPSAIRVAFMGTPDFAAPTLKALVDAGYQVVCVYSQPPRPTGRGHKVQPSPVHLYAESLGIPVRTPLSLRNETEQESFRSLDLDVAVVVAYGLILPQWILDAPRKGCVNVHGSLLPRWRGAAPLQRAIEAGDTQTGITIMQMDAGLDTGPMLSKGELPITSTATTPELHDAMASLGAELLVKTLPGYLTGEITPQSQPTEGVTYAHKLEKPESLLDWTLSASQLERKIRAFSPWPGSFFSHGDERIKVLEAQVVEGQGEPGLVLDDQLTIACGESALRPLRVSRPGKSPMTTTEFLRGYEILKGTRLPCPATN